jgi:hypothetical protein
MSIIKPILLLSIFLLAYAPTSRCIAGDIPASLKASYYQHCFEGLSGDKYFGSDQYTDERISYFKWSCECASDHVLTLLK